MVFMYMGGFMMGIGIEKWNVDRRMGLEILRVIGRGSEGIVLGVMMGSGFLCMWI